MCALVCGCELLRKSLMTPLSAYPLKVAFVAERNVLTHKVVLSRKVALVAERSVLSHKAAFVAKPSVLSHAI